MNVQERAAVSFYSNNLIRIKTWWNSRNIRHYLLSKWLRCRIRTQAANRWYQMCWLPCRCLPSVWSTGKREKTHGFQNKCTKIDWNRCVGIFTLTRDFVRCPQSHGFLLSPSITVNWPSIRSVICWAVWVHWNSSPDSDDVNNFVGSLRWNAMSLTELFSWTV